MSSCVQSAARSDALQDDDNLRESLRYSAAMLGELRTSFLTPQKYFELYMQVFDELRHLEVGCKSHLKFLALGHSIDKHIQSESLPVSR